jgi:hypothetical protein
MKQDEKTYFFEDTIVNLEMAKKFNWITVLIKRHPTHYEKKSKRVDYIFPDIDTALKFFLK